MAKTKKERAAAERKRQASRRANAKRNRVVVAAMPWDHGAMGAANRVGLVVEERGELDPATGKVVNPNKVTGVRRVDLLDFWHGRGSISTGGMNAAKVLRAAYEQTMRSPPALPDNDRVQASPKPDHAIDIQIERISRFAKLMKLVADEDREIVTVCVLDGGHPARVYGATKVREAFDHLNAALDRLHSAMSKPVRGAAVVDRASGKS